MSTQIHRFHDTVAVSLHDAGKTIYIKPVAAAKIADAVWAASADVRQHQFTDSKCGTVIIESDDPESDDPERNAHGYLNGPGPLPAKTKKARALQERDECRAQLAHWIKPGAIIYCIMRHVARSGTLRRISLHAINPADGEMHDITRQTAIAIGRAYTAKHNHEMAFNGHGYDCCEEAVEELAHALFVYGKTNERLKAGARLTKRML